MLNLRLFPVAPGNRLMLVSVNSIHEKCISVNVGQQLYVAKFTSQLLNTYLQQTFSAGQVFVLQVNTRSRVDVRARAAACHCAESRKIPHALVDARLVVVQNSAHVRGCATYLYECQDAYVRVYARKRS